MRAAIEKERIKEIFEDAADLYISMIKSFEGILIQSFFRSLARSNGVY